MIFSYEAYYYGSCSHERDNIVIGESEHWIHKARECGVQSMCQCGKCNVTTNVKKRFTRCECSLMYNEGEG